MLNSYLKLPYKLLHTKKVHVCKTLGQFFWKLPISKYLHKSKQIFVDCVKVIV
ncbi:AAEL017141-PA [Aedes aegypti]|uniref:AAEL017141-PA n=1 Tax=Aedes aegypti TaxID=7159 RepID=J9HJG4_AEDAE|nr:AAEL017141-PA [Aedes aegypti]